MGARRRNVKPRGPVSSSTELENQSNVGTIRRLSVKYRGKKQNRSSKQTVNMVKKKQVTTPNRRKSPRVKKPIQVTVSPYEGDIENNADTSSPEEAEAQPDTVTDNNSNTTDQNTSSKSAAGVYDFEFDAIIPDKKPEREVSPGKDTARREKRKALARSALENLRNEVTQKSKHSRTKSRKAKSSPKEHSAPSYQRTSTKRRRDKTASVSTQTPQKRRKIATAVQNPVVNLYRLSDEDILQPGGTKGHAPGTADSGVFMSPPGFSDSLKNTSTPGDTLSTPNIIVRPTQDQNESLFEEDHILAGAPDLSPVRNTGNSSTEEELINLVPVPYVEVERPKQQAENEEEEEEDVGYRTLAISKTYSDRSFLGMFDNSPKAQPKKAKKKKVPTATLR